MREPDWRCDLRDEMCSTRGPKNAQNKITRCSDGWKTEYDAYFLDNLISKETSRIKITLSSPQLLHRGYLIMRITEIVKELKLGSCVLHAAVRLLDLFMDAHSISSERLHGVAYACLFIAAKFELEGRKLPQFSEICKLGRIDPIPKYELLELEFQILSYVNWDMCMPNVTTFLNFFKKFTLSNNDYKEWCMKVSHAYCSYEELKNIIENNINLYLAATLLDVHLTLLPPSLIAAACLLAARQQLFLNYWPLELKWFSLYTYSQIDIVAIRLTNMLKKKDQYNKTVICKKRHSSIQFDDEDEGYSTGKSSTDGSAKKRRRV